MLWYKAWLESRSRFLIALMGCIAFCMELILMTPGSREPNESLFMLIGVHQALVFLWIMGVTLLMMGGLLCEQATGSCSFTLSLPVSRLRLVSIRLGMGLMQAIALGIFPWAGMLLAARVGVHAGTLSQAGFHIFLLLGGGVVFLAASLLVSSIVEGEYTAPVVGFGGIIMLVYALSSKRLVPYSPWAFMMGLGYFHRRTPWVVGPIPWLHAAVFVAVAALLAMISIRAIAQRNF